MIAVLTRLIVLAVLMFCAPQAVLAFTVQEVKSPGGITAWLVEEKTVPLIAMNFSFRAGSTGDEPGREGTTEFLSAMFDEGAGDVLSADFQARADELAMRMSFSAEKDWFEGRFQSLSRHRDASFDMLRLAITRPRFDPEPLERVRQQLVLAASNRDTDPQQMAVSAWLELAMPGDVYGRPTGGTAASLAMLTGDDLRAAHRRIFNRASLQVAVVGDIDAATLGPLLDKVFGALPRDALPAPLPPPEVASGPLVKVLERATPQSLIVFGHQGIRRDDADFIPAYVMTEILGGDGFNSRLTTEIREKRGLTYGVGFGLSPMERVGFIFGSLQTANETAAEALGVARAELARMAAEGPTQAELDEAKTFLTGSYALRFSSNAAIASQLLGLQQQNLGIGYIGRRNSLVEAVTLEQVKAQAKRLLHPDRLIVTVVGQPRGLN